MVFIAIFGAVIAIVCANNGKWGPAAVVVGIVLLLALMSLEEKKDMKAWRNARDYWYRGGPERRNK